MPSLMGTQHCVSLAAALIQYKYILYRLTVNENSAIYALQAAQHDIPHTLPINRLVALAVVVTTIECKCRARLNSNCLELAYPSNQSFSEYQFFLKRRLQINMMRLMYSPYAFLTLHLLLLRQWT